MSSMNELTILLFICALGIFIVSYILRKDNAISWIAFFISICSIGQTITDTTLDELETALLVVPMLYCMFMSGLSAMYRRVM